MSAAEGSAGWPEAGFAAVARWIAQRTGLAFPPGRRPTAELAIRRGMSRAALQEPGRYLTLLQRDEAAYEALLAELTVRESYFFREPAALELLRNEVLPGLRRRAPERPLRALSAGCAAGEELYSLAILLAQEGALDGAYLLGVDLSATAVAAARRGRYGRWSLRGVDAATLTGYFQPDGEGVVVAPWLRRRVVFARCNLASPSPPPPAAGLWGMDIVLCRNVLIYLGPQAVRRVAELLWRALAEGGWLLTGAADPPLAGCAPLVAVPTPAGLLYRRRPAGGRPRLAPPRRAVRQEAEPGRLEKLPTEPEATPVPRLVPVAAPRSAREPAAEPPAGADPATGGLSPHRSRPAPGELAAALQDHDPERAQEAAAAARRLREHANRFGAAAALAAAERALASHPLASELHFLRAMLLLDLGREGDSEAALRRVLYLDSSLAAAHLALGSLLARRGAHAEARRACRNALRLAAAAPPDQAVALADDESAATIARAARALAASLPEVEA